MGWGVHAVVGKKKEKSGMMEGGRKRRREEGKEESKITFYIYKVFQDESPNTCH